MRILLLSDLHIGHDSESQEIALLSLVDAIRSRIAPHRVDLVLLAGDLAHSGQEIEYNRLSNLLISPLRGVPELNRTQFIAVPGNHDVDCNIGYPPTIDALGDRLDEFFYLNEAGRRLRQSRADAFSAYSTFLQNANINGVDPLVEPARSIVVTSNDKELQVICLITSFFSSKDIKEERRTVPAPIHPLRLLLARSKKDIVKLVIGHHPKTWFTEETEQQMENLLIDNNAVYVHGHEHRIHTDFGNRGLMTIGFGAAYQSSLHDKPKPYYRNSFAICEVDENLHVDIVSWDYENGRWDSETHLPASFSERSNILPNGRVLPLPSSLLRLYSTTPSVSSLAVSPIVPRLSGCFWLADNHRSRWIAILREFGMTHSTAKAFRPPTEGLPEGHLELRIPESNGHHLIHAVSAHGDVISYEQIENLNTMFDTEPLGKCSVITLGHFADKAKTLIDRLSGVKAIVGIDGHEFTKLWMKHSNSPLVMYARSLELPSASMTLVVTTRGYALVVADDVRSRWFYVVGNDGEFVPESDSLVFSLRQVYPSLDTLAYHYPMQETNAPDLKIFPDVQKSGFDRDGYLSDCYTTFDDVRYAPLAAVGFRFRSTSLKDLYIPTSADVDGAARADQSLRKAIDEYVESLGLDDSLRAQIESQLRSQYGIGRSAEVGAARQMYQRYGNVLILDDPGSGKTCFVKYEMLAYCQPPSDSGSWYEQHIPIYVPLAEAADQLRTGNDLLTTCSTIAARRKLNLPRETIVECLSDGRAAFFFDGLDEVGRLDERIHLVGELNDIISKFAQHGNRFVLTSRPVAVQSVDVPKIFTYLHLKGLTDIEIRMLAERVLTTRLGTDEQGSLTTEEQELVEKLLGYVNNSEGLRRISRNPLLLTLLVLIYANTGALSARRHIVYTQAVRTLVSYRHRETREQVLPEADLRTQLGTLAYAIYRRKINELPSRREVVDILKPCFEANRDDGENSDTKIDEFLRRVAEATGLLVVHPRVNLDDGKEELISFMHHSFLEYYAAVGILAQDLNSELKSLAISSQWRDVTTLLFGLLSEHSDISPYIQSVLELDSEVEEITNDKLLLALECAVECDVPPVETQKLLANRLRQSLSSGALGHSDEMRESVANALSQLVESAGLEIFEPMFLDGMSNSNATIAAAFVDFVGRLRDPMHLSARMVEQFENIYAKSDSAVLNISCAGAFSRRADFRTEVSIDALGDGFGGNILERHAVLKAVTMIPSLAQRYEEKIVDLLDDPNTLIVSAAAQCVLLSGISSKFGERNRRSLEKAVSRWRTSNRSLHRTTASEQRAFVLDEQYISALLESGDARSITLGAGVLPLANVNDKTLHGVLFETMRRHENHEVRRACLDSLAMRSGVLDLVTLADRDYLCEMVKAEHRDVRIGTLRVLGMLPSDEEIILVLLHFCGFGDNEENVRRMDEELYEGFRALGEHARSDVVLKEKILEKIFLFLPRPNAREFGDENTQRQVRNLLVVSERMGLIDDARLSAHLLTLSKNFRTPKRLRSQALRVYGNTVRPSSTTIREIVTFVERKDRNLRDASYAACHSLLTRCGKRVEFVRDVYGELGALRIALMNAWKRERRRVVDNIDSVGLGNIRRALGEVEALLHSYEQYVSRVDVSKR